MSSLRSESTLNCISTTNSLPRNPFLIFRVVFLALLCCLAFLSLIFASWNINASLSAGLSASSTSAFVIFESCVLFTCATLTLVEFFRPVGVISYIAIECSWIGILSLFQMGTAISATVNGPVIACHTSSTWGVCASSSLLVPTTWLSSITFLTYFFAVFLTTMAHRHLYPDIWRRKISTIEWFGQPSERSSKEKTIQDFFRGSPHHEDPYYDYYEDVESTPARKKLYAIRDSVEVSTPWAPLNVRRGIDHPFSRPEGQKLNCSSPAQQSLALPLLPSKSAGVGTAGSRYVEKFRESSVLSRSESSAQYTKHYHADKNLFPPSVADLDKPIPLPEVSEWIRADSGL